MYTVRAYEEKDLAGIFNLVKQLAIFEKAPQAVINSIERMKKEQHLFGCFIAKHLGVIVGFALYFFSYSTWVGKSLYLEDLYIEDAHRKKGIGKILLDNVFMIAKKEDCQRVRWQVLNWNKNALDFYKKNGASIDTEWYNCNYDAQAIKNYNSSK